MRPCLDGCLKLMADTVTLDYQSFLEALELHCHEQQKRVMSELWSCFFKTALDQTLKTSMARHRCWELNVRAKQLPLGYWACTALRKRGLPLAAQPLAYPPCLKVLLPQASLAQIPSRVACTNNSKLGLIGVLCSSQLATHVKARGENFFFFW